MDYLLVLTAAPIVAIAQRARGRRGSRPSDAIARCSQSVTGILANAIQIAQVPGRKTDVNDTVWIAQLLEHGLIRPSSVPPPPIRELRDLTRYRKLLIQERTRHANRLHQVLEDAGITLKTTPVWIPIPIRASPACIGIVACTARRGWSRSRDIWNVGRTTLN